MRPDPNTTIIDLTPDGRFTRPPRAGLQLTGWTAWLLMGAAAAAAIVLALWLAVTLIPVVLIMVGMMALLGLYRRWRGHA